VGGTGTGQQYGAEDEEGELSVWDGILSNHVVKREGIALRVFKVGHPSRAYKATTLKASTYYCRSIGHQKAKIIGSHPDCGPKPIPRDDALHVSHNSNTDSVGLRARSP